MDVVQFDRIRAKEMEPPVLSCMEVQTDRIGQQQAKMLSITPVLTRLRKDPASIALEEKTRLLNVHVPYKDLNADLLVYLGKR